jgi:hypothetical protein
VWFDADLADGIRLTSAPGEAVAVYPRKFAPWTHPVGLHAGDTIQADFRFVWVNHDYVWRWNTSIRAADGQPREQFRQSSFNSMYITAEPVRKRRPAFRPRLDPKGEAERAILQLMDQRLTLQEIAQEVTRHYPDVFSDDDTALKAVADISEEFSQVDEEP